MVERKYGKGLENMKAIVGFPKAYRISVSDRGIDLHLVVSDGKEDFTVVILTNEKDFEFWEKMFDEITKSLKSLKNKDLKKDDINYIR